LREIGLWNKPATKTKYRNRRNATPDWRIQLSNIEKKRSFADKKNTLCIEN
jgi:hypothetical protein